MPTQLGITTIREPGQAKIVMSDTHEPDRTSELGELFVTVTGDDTVTEDQVEGASKEPAEEDDDEDLESAVDDGLDGAVGADLDANA